MKFHNAKISYIRYPRLILVFFLISLFSAYMYTFATPPGSPYQPGATLDPTCLPASTNCSVQIIPDQTGNNGKYLTTNGSATSWIALTGVTQWVTTGSDIYYPTGNVGIGTSTPTEALDITGNINLTNDGTDRYIQSVSSGIVTGSSLFIIAGNGQSASAATGGNLNLRGGNGSGGFGPGNGGDVLIDGGSKTGFGVVGDVLLATLRGNVGVGTTAPFAQLTNYNANISDANGFGMTSQAFGWSSTGSGGYVAAFENREATSVRHGILVKTAATDNASYIAKFESGGANRLTLRADGNVGIGTSSPTEILDVSGNIRFSGALMPNNLAGTSGQVLTSAGAGVVPTWTTPSTVATSVPLSGLTAATGSNTIDNLNNFQTWGWSGAALGGGLLLTETSTGGNSSFLFGLSSSGVNSSSGRQTFTADISNSHTGTLAENIAMRLSASGGTNNYALIVQSGSVGIGTSNPGFLLHIGSSAVVDGTTLLRLEDTNTVCDFNANAGAPSCGSDLTLKKDISSLDTTDLLTKVSSLNPVSYRWLTEESSVNLQYGFIAQEVATQFPELVTDHTWIDGTTKKFLNTGGLMPYVVGAVKEMNIKITGINDLEKENTLRDTLVSWLANAGNKITRIFTGEICLTDPDGTSECINKTELHNLKQLLNNQNSGGGSGNGDTNPPPNPPADGGGSADVCPNIEGEQASIPDGYHLDSENNCVVDEEVPSTEETPSSENPAPAGNPTPTE